VDVAVADRAGNEIDSNIVRPRIGQKDLLDRQRFTEHPTHSRSHHRTTLHPIRRAEKIPPI
jgi:hypothetical protein